ENNTKVRSEEWTYFAFWWNLQLPMFQDKNTRLALSLAFDHQEMLQTYRRGLDSPCLGLFASSSPWFPKDAGIEPLKRDVEQAKKLLAEAGWQDSDNDGILDKMANGQKLDFKFTILTTNKPDRVEMCNLLRTNLREVGIEVTVQPLEFNVYMQNMHEKKYQASFGGWGAGADPYTAWNVWGSGEARNYISYSNPEVDQLFREGEVEFDRAKRIAIYQKIHQLIYEDVPCTWLFNQNGYYGYNKKIRGLGFYPRGPLYGCAWKAAMTP
ncbi:MAG: ABC transporter substrate-binding protein, partial [Planctomycetia bacterium]|nr:ABC transporter substrate-binding protein [Planctomycetia bacterium]